MSTAVATALVAWGNAWLTGHVGLDEAVDAVERNAGPQILCGAPAEVTLRRGLGDLRVGGMTALRLALPRPGDPLGLTGPPALNGAAIEAGSAVVAVLDDRAIGLVPAEDRRGSSYVGVRWTAHDASPGPPDVPGSSTSPRPPTPRTPGRPGAPRSSAPVPSPQVPRPSPHPDRRPARPQDGVGSGLPRAAGKTRGGGSGSYRDAIRFGAWTRVRRERGLTRVGGARAACGVSCGA